MKIVERYPVSAQVAALLRGWCGRAGMSSQEQSPAIGAVVLKGSSPVGTIGGATVGGIIGNQVGKD
jgi:osmotically inducible lipoprotein OsmB